jgi:hypothetical protein
VAWASAGDNRQKLHKKRLPQLEVIVCHWHTLTIYQIY